MSGVSLTHPKLYFCLGSFSYTSQVCFVFLCGVSLTHPVLTLFLCGEFLLHILCIVLPLFLTGEFLLHIPCWLHFYLGSFSYTSHPGFIFYQGIYSYTSRAGFIFMQGICLTHPVLPSFLYWEFLLHTPSCLHLYMGGCFSHISCWLLFMRGVSLTHPVLAFLDVRSVFPQQSTLKTIP